MIAGTKARNRSTKNMFRQEPIKILSLFWRVNLLSQVCRNIFIKLSWKALILIHFTLSPVIFISIITSIIFSSTDEIPINSIDSPGRAVVGYSTVALSVAFSTKVQIRYARKTKRGDIIFSITELFPLLVRFSPLKYFNTFLKNALQLSADHHAGWPLCKLGEHRLSVPDSLA